MSKENVDISKMIDEETLKRLEIMSKPDYEWPEKADRKDVIAIVVSIVICIGLIMGCVLGVIR